MKDILILSDMHVGSLWGLWPPDFEADDPRGDNRLKFIQNHTQKQLWKHWKTMADKVKPEIIIFNGDLIDGQQRRSVGREVVASRIEMSNRISSHKHILGCWCCTIRLVINKNSHSTLLSRTVKIHRRCNGCKRLNNDCSTKINRFDNCFTSNSLSIISPLSGHMN